MLIRGLLLVILLALPGLGPALGHEGHSHGEEAAPPAAAAPRAEAHSELFEIVAVLGTDGRLWLYLDRHATSEPIDGASIQVSIDGSDVGMDARAGEAVYAVASPTLTQPGRRNLVFSITAGDDMDLLPAELEIPPAAATGTAAPGAADRLAAAAREPYLWAAGLILVLFGLGLGRAAAPRPLPPRVVMDAPATVTRPRCSTASAAQPWNGCSPCSRR